MSTPTPTQSELNQINQGTNLPTKTGDGSGAPQAWKPNLGTSVWPPSQEGSTPTPTQEELNKINQGTKLPTKDEDGSGAWPPAAAGGEEGNGEPPVEPGEPGEPGDGEEPPEEPIETRAMMTPTSVSASQAARRVPRRGGRSSRDLSADDGGSYLTR